jgi:hypothetical protein
MQSMRHLNTISDDELLDRLTALLQSSRHTEADLVAHIGEVDARRLYAREASPSMWSYCTERLHLSGAEAYLRIAAARASREHQVLLDMLADGRLHLTAIALLAPYLTAENRESLLQRATHRTKRQIEELIAEIDPRPDAPARIRKLPDTTASLAAAAPALRATPARPGGTPLSPSPPLSLSPSPWLATSGQGADTAATSATALRLDEVVSDGLDGAARPSQRPERVTARPATIEPLSPARYKVQFTASAELREKLARLQALMRSAVPDGDLAAVIDAAVTEKLERLERRRFGRTKAPRKTLAQTDPSPRSRHVPAAVRRAVDERDGGRCRYVDDRGRRCTSRAAPQFHHRHLYAMGGDHSPANVALLCPMHNLYLAEIDCGRNETARHRRSG